MVINCDNFLDVLKKDENLRVGCVLIMFYVVFIDYGNISDKYFIKRNKILVVFYFLLIIYI